MRIHSLFHSPNWICLRESKSQRIIGAFLLPNPSRSIITEAQRASTLQLVGLKKQQTNK
jgi:hypothetical protein